MTGSRVRPELAPWGLLAAGWEAGEGGLSLQDKVAGHAAKNLLLEAEGVDVGV